MKNPMTKTDDDVTCRNCHQTLRAYGEILGIIVTSHPEEIVPPESVRPRSLRMAAVECRTRARTLEVEAKRAEASRLRVRARERIQEEQEKEKDIRRARRERERAQSIRAKEKEQERARRERKKDRRDRARAVSQQNQAREIDARLTGIVALAAGSSDRLSTAVRATLKKAGFASPPVDNPDNEWHVTPKGERYMRANGIDCGDIDRLQAWAAEGTSHPRPDTVRIGKVMKTIRDVKGPGGSSWTTTGPGRGRSRQHKSHRSGQHKGKRVRGVARHGVKGRHNVSKSDYARGRMDDRRLATEPEKSP